MNWYPTHQIQNPAEWFSCNLSFSLPGNCKLHPCCPCLQLFLPSCRIGHSVWLKIKTEKKKGKFIYKHGSNQHLKEGFPFSSFNIINISLLWQWLKLIFSVLNSFVRIAGRKYQLLINFKWTCLGFVGVFFLNSKYRR